MIETHSLLQHITSAKHALARTEPHVLPFRKATCVLARITTLDHTVNVSVMCKMALVATDNLVSLLFSINVIYNATIFLDYQQVFELIFQ